MRVTSSMMTNNMILNVNRAMRNVDHTWLKFSSGKRIHTPSDNPLVSARAMKFRTNLVENENFQSNADQALAWMDVTEGSLDNVMNVLMNEARDTLNRIHNDPLALEPRNALITYLRSIFDQVTVEMNTQFAGRYIFSGLRTDQPPIFTRDQPNLWFEITQSFDLRDVESTRSLQIFEPELIDPANPELGYNMNLRESHYIHRLKLPFRGENMSVPVIEGFNVIEWSNTHRGAYVVPDTADPGALPDPVLPTVHFIRETGELIFNSAQATGIAGMDIFPIDVTYERWNFLQGELNPAVYFDAQLLYAPDGHSLRHLVELRYGGAQPTPTWPGPQVVPPTGPMPVMPTVARLVPLLPTAPDPGAPIPGTTAYQAHTATIFDMNNQELRFEFSTHVTIPVNTLAKNVVTANLFADLQNLIEFIENIQPIEETVLREIYAGPPTNLTGYALDNAVSEHIANQTATINYAMNNRFNNMLFLIDRHAAVARREYTDIGSRGRRIELIQNRLETDEGSLYRLKSNNENVDMARLATLMATAEAQYMAALRVGTNIINVTLANFLQV